MWFSWGSNNFMHGPNYKFKVKDIILLTPHLYRDRGGNVLVQDWRDGTEVDGLTLLSPYHLVLTDQSIREGNVNGG